MLELPVAFADALDLEVGAEQLGRQRVVGEQIVMAGDGNPDVELFCQPCGFGGREVAEGAVDDGQQNIRMVRR